MALYDAMVGNQNSQYTMFNLASIQPLEEVPIRGHVSTLLLLEGLIGVIGSLLLSIFMFWGISDAYKVSEAKRLKQKVLGDVKYFKDVYERSFEYIILFPAIVVLAFISIMPISFGFVIAFTNISGNASMVDTFDWVGLKNFIALFNFASGLGSSFGQAFWRVLGWTVVWAILSTFTVFFGGFFQALILNSESVVFRKFWRTILILPWAIPALLSQMVFSVMFNEFGFINALLQDVGIYDVLTNLGMLKVPFDSLTGLAKFFYLGQDNIQWFTNPFNPTFVRTALVVVNIWLGFPYFMALMTGVMTAIDATLYEAADIDGANRFQKIFQITMPLVLYSTAPILIMTFSGNFNNFGVIYFVTGGGPNAGVASRGFAGDTDILISWMYKLTVDYSIYNMASVFSVLIFLFVGSITAWNLSRTRAFQED
jgi:arabinogalactan oligomer/maltooligosaccharide transport system permease protein